MSLGLHSPDRAAATVATPRVPATSACESRTAFGVPRSYGYDSSHAGLTPGGLSLTEDESVIDPEVKRRRYPRLKMIADLLIIVAMANFVLFTAGAARLGGDALNGKVENGSYYVMTKGKYTQIPRAVWIYSRIHAIALIVNFVAAIGTYFLVVFLERGRRIDRN